MSRNTASALRAATAALAATMLCLASASPADAKTFLCDAGDVSCLIAAIEAANANGKANTIRLAAGTYTIDAPWPDPAPVAIGFGRAAVPTITGTLTIRGEGAADTIIERDALASDSFRLFTVTGQLTLESMAVRNGGAAVHGGAILTFGLLTLKDTMVTASASREGGGIAIEGGTSVITNSSILGNQAVEGGGLYVNGGTLFAANCTIAANVGTFGGGATVHSGGAATFTSCTFSANRANLGSAINEGIPADAPIGIIQTYVPGTVLVQSSTIARNLSAAVPFRGRPINSLRGTISIGGSLLSNNSPDTTGDCPQAGAASLGFNLVRTPLSTFSFPLTTTTDCDHFLLASDLVGDPLLGAFVDTGTPGGGYFPLSAGSPAIDAGGAPASKKNSKKLDWPFAATGTCPATDQLGQPRSGRCDIGSIEALFDRVTIRRAEHDADTGVFLIVAATTGARDGATLTASVPGCFDDQPMLQIGRTFYFLSQSGCDNLTDPTAVVRSSLGGSASAPVAER